MRVLLFVVLLPAGCATGVPCRDPDLDGFGVGCPLGLDCDEGNPVRNSDCDAVPEPDCDVQSVQPGCRCFTHREASCYLGPAETDSVGSCAPGRIECLEGRWGLCVGQTLPVPERCDGIDEDCDGVVDDGAQSPCGGCNPACVGGVAGEGASPFDIRSETAQDVELAEDGAVVLRARETARGSLWVANSMEATISRLDTRTGRQTARYRSGGTDPSRTAIDYVGDAYVANRAFEGQASVTKIAGDLSRCQDRDQDGQIATSLAGDDVLGQDEDECVLFRTDVGGWNAVARALAVDSDLGLDAAGAGLPWVGLYNEQRVLRLDAQTGEVTREVRTLGLKPYGAAMGPDGILWVAGLDAGVLARFDTRDPRVTEAEIVPIRQACNLSYGIAVDPTGAVWLGGWSCAAVLRYDTAADRWDRIATDESVRGIAVTEHGIAYASHTGGLVSELDGQDVLRRFVLYDGIRRGLETVGVAIDADGKVWAVSRQGGFEGRGLATRIDPGDASIAHFEVGVDPYTYSDMTGHALAVVSEPLGHYIHLFEGCAEPGTHWDALHFDGFYPAGSAIDLSMRRADDIASLEAGEFLRVASGPEDPSPMPLELEDGGVVQVRAVLRASDRFGTPRLTRLAVEWRCPGPG